MFKKFTCLFLVITLFALNIVYANDNSMISKQGEVFSQKFVRGKGQPQTETATFSTLSGKYKITIQNGDSKKTRVSSGVVSINGEEIVNQSDFNKNQNFITKYVYLKNTNIVEVKLTSAPDSFIVLGVQEALNDDGNDDDSNNDDDDDGNDEDNDNKNNNYDDDDYYNNNNNNKEVEPIPNFSIREFEESDIVQSEIYENYKYVKGEIIISATLEATYQQIHDLVASYGGKIVGYLEVINEYQTLFDDGKTESSLLQIIDNFNNNNLVLHASLNLVSELEEPPIAEAILEEENGISLMYTLQEIEQNSIFPNDTKWSASWEDYKSNKVGGFNWNMEAIDAPMAWKILEERKVGTVKVGIIDEGFYTNHEDLTFTKILNTNTSTNTDHAMHVSGIIGATANNDKGIAGLLWKSELYGFEYSGKNPTLKMTLFKIKYAISSLFAENINIINASFGNTTFLETDKKLKDIPFLIHEAQSLGVFLNKYITLKHEFVIIQSAGNGSKNNYRLDTRYNGVFSNINEQAVQDRIIIVGNMELLQNRTNTYNIYEESQVGNKVDIMAPGYNIYSTISLPRDVHADNSNEPPKTEDFYYYNMKGTSMAAPHVTGVVGMVWSINPNLTGEAVKKLIIDSCKTTLSINITMRSETEEELEAKVEESNITMRSATEEELKLEYPVLNANNAVKDAINSLKNSSTLPPSSKQPVLFGRVVHKPKDNLVFGVGNVKVEVYKEGLPEKITELRTMEKIQSMYTEDIGTFTLFLEDLDKDNYIGNYTLLFYKDGYKNNPMSKQVTIDKEVTFHEFDLVGYPLGVEVSIDGNKIKYDSDIFYPTPEIIKFAGSDFSLGDSFLHIKPIAEALGYVVTWNETEQRITLTKELLETIELVIDAQTFTRTIWNESERTEILAGRCIINNDNNLAYLSIVSLRVIFNMDSNPTEQLIEAGTDGGHYTFGFTK